jgi:hypothetical protein
MADFQDNLDEAATVVELCSAVTGISRQLQAQKHKNPELVDAVYHAVGDTAAGLRNPTAKVTGLPNRQLVNQHGG